MEHRFIISSSILLSLLKHVQLLTFEGPAVDFDSSLQAFQSCSVHLMFGSLGSTNYDIYDLIAIGFPVILSSFQYIPCSFDGVINSDFCCSFCQESKYKTAYRLKPGQGFVFKAEPHLRQNCDVQVYITPKQCKAWMRFTRANDGYTSWIEFVPFSYLFNYVKDEIATSMLHSVRRASTGKFFVLVSLYSYELVDAISSPFGVVDASKENNKDEHEPGVLVTKLFFKLAQQKELDKDKAVLKVSTIYQVENIPISALLADADACQKLILSKQGHQSGSEIVLTAMAHLQCEYSMLAASVYPMAPIPISQLSRLEIEKLQEFSYNKEPLTWYIVYSSSQKKPLPYMQWDKLGLRSWKSAYTVEPILLSIISPNATIHADNLYHNYGEETTSCISPVLQVSTKFTPQSSWWADGKGLYFITCGVPVHTNSMSFAGYVSAFGWEFWTALIIMSVFSVVFLLIFSSQAKSSTGRMNLAVPLSDFLLFPYCILVEQSTNILEKCRWVSAAWVLIGIVVSTCYRGENIDQLTSPLSHTTIDTFPNMAKANLPVHSPNLFHAGVGQIATTSEHLDSRIKVHPTQFAEYRAYYTKIMNFVINSVKITYKKFFHLLSEKQIFVLYYPIYHWAVTFAFGNVTVEDRRKLDDYLSNLTIPATLQESFAISSDSEYFMKRLRQCRSEVYVDTYNEIYRMKQKLKREFSEKLYQIKVGTLKEVKNVSYDPQRIIMSKDKLVSIGKSFITFRVPWPYEVLTRRVLALSESGLSNLWHDWANRILVWNDTVQFAKNFDLAKGLSLRDNTVVIFILYLTVIPAMPLLILVIYELNIFKLLVYFFSKAIRKVSGYFDDKKKTKVLHINIESSLSKH